MDNNLIVYAVKRTDYCDDFTTILCIDGGIAEIHHNGENYVTTYFQDRIEGEYSEESWLKLADGKQYCKDWVDKDKIDEEMIYDALEWLHPMAIDFREVEFQFLNNQISRK
jgi:hypothetical protein